MWERIRETMFMHDMELFMIAPWCHGFGFSDWFAFYGCERCDLPQIKHLGGTAALALLILCTCLVRCCFRLLRFYWALARFVSRIGHQAVAWPRCSLTRWVSVTTWPDLALLLELCPPNSWNSRRFVANSPRCHWICSSILLRQ